MMDFDFELLLTCACGCVWCGLCLGRVVMETSPH